MGESPRKVLVVDDNTAAAESVARLLQLLGHEARCVYDGKTALSVAPEYQPDTVLIDLMMPEMDGLELARRLRDLPLKAKLVALTAFGQQRLLDDTGRCGFDGFLVKPATADELEWSLRQ